MPLNVNDVIRCMSKKKERQRQCFDGILEKCYRKIERSATLNQSNCYYEVPEFVLGYPLYNINECIVHLLHSLKNNGFLVQYFFPRVIHVSWKTPDSEDTFSKNLLSLMNSQMPLSHTQIPLSIQHQPDFQATQVPIPTANANTSYAKNIDVNTSSSNRLQSNSSPVSVPVMAKKRGGKKVTKPIAEFKPSGKFVLNLGV